MGNGIQSILKNPPWERRMITIHGFLKIPSMTFGKFHSDG